MQKLRRTLAFIGMCALDNACGEPMYQPVMHDGMQQIFLDVDAGADASTSMDAAPASGCVEVAIACITYTCVNSGECDPKNQNNTPSRCYACITAATKGALCKHFIEDCGQLAACLAKR